jgi:hypothetical protein
MEFEMLMVFAGVYGLLVVLIYKTFKIEGKIKDTTVSEKYNPALTLWKFAKQLIFGGTSYVLVETISKYLISLQNIDSFLIIALIAVFNAVTNYIKFR